MHHPTALSCTLTKLSSLPHSPDRRPNVPRQCGPSWRTRLHERLPTWRTNRLQCSSWEAGCHPAAHRKLSAFNQRLPDKNSAVHLPWPALSKVLSLELACWEWPALPQTAVKQSAQGHLSQMCPFLPRGGVQTQHRRTNQEMGLQCSSSALHLISVKCLYIPAPTIRSSQATRCCLPKAFLLEPAFRKYSFLHQNGPPLFQVCSDWEAGTSLPFLPRDGPQAHHKRTPTQKSGFLHRQRPLLLPPSLSGAPRKNPIFLLGHRTLVLPTFSKTLQRKNAIPPS